MKNEKAVIDRLRSIALLAHKAATDIERARSKDFAAGVAQDAYDDIALDLAQLRELTK